MEALAAAKARWRPPRRAKVATLRKFAEARTHYTAQQYEHTLGHGPVKLTVPDCGVPVAYVWARRLSSGPFGPSLGQFGPSFGPFGPFRHWPQAPSEMAPLDETLLV